MVNTIHPEGAVAMEVVLQYPFQRTSPRPTLLAKPTQSNSRYQVVSPVLKAGSMSKSTKAPYRQVEVHQLRSVEHPSPIQTAGVVHGHSTGQPLLPVAEQSLSTLQA